MTADERQATDDELDAALCAIGKALEQSVDEAWTVFVGAAIRGDTGVMRTALEQLAAARASEPIDVLANCVLTLVRQAENRYGPSVEIFDIPADGLARLPREWLEGLAHSVALLAFTDTRAQGPAH